MLSQPVYSSYIENRFSSVERQQHDSTCGIASLSNILNIHYHIKKTELELLKYLSIKQKWVKWILRVAGIYRNHSAKQSEEDV